MTTIAIDITPSWEGILPMLLLLIECGDVEGQRTAKAELAKMARLADQWVAHCDATEAKG